MISGPYESVKFAKLWRFFEFWQQFENGNLSVDRESPAETDNFNIS